MHHCELIGARGGEDIKSELNWYTCPSQLMNSLGIHWECVLELGMHHCEFIGARGSEDIKSDLS